MKNDLLENKILQNNLTHFSQRFPELGKFLFAHAQKNYILPETELMCAKNGEVTASFRGKLLHSAYNPSSEAKKLSESDTIDQADSIVFYGVGLGYGPIECAKQHKTKTLIIIEPDFRYLLWAFSLIDWQPVFALPSCIFLLEAPQQSVIVVLEQFGLKTCTFITQKNYMEHAIPYFSALQELIARNKDKQGINERTLERFSTLWLSNMCKNLPLIAKLEGVDRYKNKAESLTACVLAAGPGLDAILPYLEDIKKRCILICVDTALRACLLTGVQPHFIVLIDPQYWNARHLDGLSASKSILITESAAYPSIFRFACQEIILCSSLFPLGKYIESFIGKKGELAAGGSVATTAWDFARFIGCKTIFMAGLDLSYPDKKTHARGSTFEENSHIQSKKIAPTETANAHILYNSNTVYALNYDGEELLTDVRMKLYSWWFESKCVAFPTTDTFSLSSKSLAIPGIKPCNITRILALPTAEKDIQGFYAIRETCIKEHNLDKSLSSLFNDLIELQGIAQQGIILCQRNYKTETDYATCLKKLDKIDTKIHKSKAKNIAAFVFPTPNQLEKLIKEKIAVQPPFNTYISASRHNILKSQILYEAVVNSITIHIHYLQKNILNFRTYP